MINSLAKHQLQTESDFDADSSKPTSEISSKIFGITARLTNNLNNEPLLEKIGKAYGEYIYLIDAVNDYTKDMRSKDYNLLRKFSVFEQSFIQLTPHGIDYLAEKFHKICKEIQSHLDNMAHQGIICFCNFSYILSYANF